METEESIQVSERGALLKKKLGKIDRVKYSDAGSEEPTRCSLFSEGPNTSRGVVVDGDVSAVEKVLQLREILSKRRNILEMSLKYSEGLKTENLMKNTEIKLTVECLLENLQREIIQKNEEMMLKIELHFSSRLSQIEQVIEEKRRSILQIDAGLEELANIDDPAEKFNRIERIINSVQEQDEFFNDTTILEEQNLSIGKFDCEKIRDLIRNLDVEDNGCSSVESKKSKKIFTSYEEIAQRCMDNHDDIKELSFSKASNRKLKALINEKENACYAEGGNDTNSKTNTITNIKLRDIFSSFQKSDSNTRYLLTDENEDKHQKSIFEKMDSVDSNESMIKPRQLLKKSDSRLKNSYLTSGNSVSLGNNSFEILSGGHIRKRSNIFENTGVPGGGSFLKRENSQEKGSRWKLEEEDKENIFIKINSTSAERKDRKKWGKSDEYLKLKPVGIPDNTKKMLNFQKGYSYIPPDVNKKQLKIEIDEVFNPMKNRKTCLNDTHNKQDIFSSSSGFEQISSDFEPRREKSESNKLQVNTYLSHQSHKGIASKTITPRSRIGDKVSSWCLEPSSFLPDSTFKGIDSAFKNMKLRENRSPLRMLGCLERQKVNFDYKRISFIV